MSVREEAAHCFPLVRRKGKTHDRDRQFPFDISTQILPMFQSAGGNAGEQNRIARHRRGGQRGVCVLLFMCHPLCVIVQSAPLLRASFSSAATRPRTRSSSKLKMREALYPRPPPHTPPQPQSEGWGSEEEEQRGLGFMFPPVMFCHSSTSKKSLFVSFLFPFSKLRMDGG